MFILGMQYRSIVGSLLQAPWACGYAFLALVAYICRSWTSIQVFSKKFFEPKLRNIKSNLSSKLITSTLHLFALCLIHHLPESPRWLIVTNRVDEVGEFPRKCFNFYYSFFKSIGRKNHSQGVPF